MVVVIAGCGGDVLSVASQNYKLGPQHFTVAQVVHYVYDTCDHGKSDYATKKRDI